MTLVDKDGNEVMPGDVVDVLYADGSGAVGLEIIEIVISKKDIIARLSDGRFAGGASLRLVER